VAGARGKARSPSPARAGRYGFAARSVERCGSIALKSRRRCATHVLGDEQKPITALGQLTDISISGAGRQAAEVRRPSRFETSAITYERPVAEAGWIGWSANAVYRAAPMAMAPSSKTTRSEWLSG
jgi:hypothetical protein